MQLVEQGEAESIGNFRFSNGALQAMCPTSPGLEPSALHRSPSCTIRSSIAITERRESIVMPIRLRFVFALFLSMSALCAASVVHAQQCSDRTLKGSFGYTVTGSIVTPVGPLVSGPFAAVGRIVFDGDGHVSTVRSLSDNGNVIQNDSGSGTYTLKSDCTGSFNITVGPPGEAIVLDLNIVFDGSGELRGLVTNPGIVLAFDGRRQNPVSY